MRIALLALFLLVQFGCSDDPKINVDKLNGTWVDSESFALSFIEFDQDNKGRFGRFGKQYEKYDEFKYRISDNTIAIDFTANDVDESTHHFTFLGKDTVQISDLTVIPENPLKTYIRRDVITERANNAIVIGLNEIYYDLENGFQLRLDSIVEDSRCPKDAQCVWAGNARVRLNLIVDGNYQYEFDLNTHEDFRRDTLIRGINYELIEVFSSKHKNSKIEYKDYKVKIVTKK